MKLLSNEGSSTVPWCFCSSSFFLYLFKQGKKLTKEGVNRLFKGLLWLPVTIVICNYKLDDTTFMYLTLIEITWHRIITDSGRSDCYHMMYHKPIQKAD